MNGFNIVASRPGQISLAIDKLRGNHDLTREFQTDLSGIRGINRVEADPEQGLVVVSYNKQQVTSLLSLLALKATFSTFFAEVNVMQLASRLSESW
jgi:hypothetical protein